MKKILSFLVAGALALGLIGCSGDLHDAAPAPLGLMGIDTSICIPMEFEGTDNSVQTLKFTWSADATLKNINGGEPKVQEGWGGSARLQFKIILPSGINADGTPDWSKDRAGDDNKLFITLNASEPTKLLSREESGAGDPQHVVVEGLVDGEEYVLTAYYDATKESVSVICTGAASDPNQFRITADKEDSLNFPAKDKEEKNIIYAMTKGDGHYEYQFIAKANETVSLKVSNDLIGTDASKDFTFVKDCEYLLKYVKPKIGSAGTFTSEPVSLLKKAEVLPFEKTIFDVYDEDVYKWFSDAHSKIYFTPTSTTADIRINRKEGSEVLAWNDATVASANDEASAQSVTLSYINNSGDAQTEIKPIKITGLKSGAVHVMVFEEKDASLAMKVYVAVKEDLSNAVLCGSMGNDVALKKEGDDYIWEFTFTDDWYNQWGCDSVDQIAFTLLLGGAGDWSTQTRYPYFMEKNFASGFSYGKKYDNAVVNGHFEDGKKYKMIFTPNYAYVDVSLEIVE